MNVKPGQWFWRLFALLLLSSYPVAAEDLKIEARLIWGTNNEKSPDPSHKLVEGKTAENLRKVFAWKNYFDVSRTHGLVPNRGTNVFKVSKDCTVEIAEMEGPKVGVLLIGKGKPQNRTVKTLSRGESFVLGGDLKDQSAWFVIISQLDDKTPIAAPGKNGESKPSATNTASK